VSASAVSLAGGGEHDIGAHDKYDKTKGWGSHGVVACEQPWSARGIQVQMMQASVVVVVVVGSACVDAISGKGEWSGVKERGGGRLMMLSP
jgi:hypothetical protein